MNGSYADMLCLPRPKPRCHPELTPWQRAAQFSPFAALTGFDAVVAEEGRLTDSMMELGEDARLALDAQLSALAKHAGDHPQVSVTWFCPDSRKAGGSYVTTLGYLKKLDQFRQSLVLQTGQSIPFSQILWVQA